MTSAVLDSIFHSSAHIFTSLAPISGHFSQFLTQIGSRIGPDGLFWPPLSPSWPHLGHPLGLLGATLGHLGLPFAMPRPLLKPILVIWDPKGTFWEYFSQISMIPHDFLMKICYFLHNFYIFLSKFDSVF